MFHYESYLQQQLHQLKENGNYRYFLDVNKSARHFPVFYYEAGGTTRRAINFCSNDYLGMSVEEDVIAKLSFTLIRAELVAVVQEIYPVLQNNTFL